MPETRLLDYSTARPAMSEIRRSGAVGVMRYLTSSTGAKRVTRAEIDQLHAAGLSVGFVWEDTAGRAREGHAAGVQDAKAAFAQATALGVPHGVVIFFADDSDTTEAEVRPYFAGVISVASPYPAGVYGDLAVVDGLIRDRVLRWGWQTVAWSGPTHPVSKLAHLYQRNSSSQPVNGTDENVLLKPFPRWEAPKAPAKRTPPAKPAPAKTYPTLKRGSTGEDVRHLEKLLQIPVDAPGRGVFGPQCETAVRNYQAKVGLKVTGVADPATLKRMRF